ncbi:stAR-related lipid transfer protein 7, mitochondrial isoform X3 [Physeter macrocephalus]|uniref:Phosphatidylcholine transfer protein n=1 Tax=Physeter macrocephalus TaxID=9755 RepID=A0A9W2X084_PHYMC|nr:stAR-related lipid transfer protein 7, mitochondrial isoform X3 [Physeter catodon]
MPVVFLSRSIDEMKRLEEMSSTFQSSGVDHHPPEPKSQTERDEDSGGKEQPWEMVMDKKHFKLWRRPITGTPLYQYRVFGTYTDVTPRQFFNVQLDTEYRKKWDALVIKLEVIERDVVSGSEVLHWVTHFPYPMYSRDYVYVRRYSVDEENNVMVLVSRAVEHPSVPESPEFVRVRSYESQMVIRPHKSFDEWLRIRLPMQGTRVRAPVREDPTCHGAARPVSHNYSACVSGACAPQRERPRQ